MTPGSAHRQCVRLWEVMGQYSVQPRLPSRKQLETVWTFAKRAGHEIKGLELRDIHVVMEKQSKWPCDSYDLRPCEGEGIRLSELYGLYVKGTENLKLSGITIECKENMREYVGGERKIL